MRCQWSQFKLSVKQFLFLPNGSVGKLFDWITQIRPLYFWSVLLAYYTLGVALNKRAPFPDFYIFQFIFLLIGIVAFWSIRYYLRQLRCIQEKVAPDRTEIFRLWERLQNSRSIVILSLLATLFFGTHAAILVNVPINTASAIYLGTAFTTSTIISFFGYFQFISLKLLIYKLRGSCQLLDYDNEYPANTGWLVALAKLSTIYRNCFFFLGTCYLVGVFRFWITDAFGISQKITLHPENSIILFSFVGCAILAIAVVFPICSYLEYRWLTKITGNLKDASVRVLRQRTTRDPQISQLIISILSTPDYPFNDLGSNVLSILFGTINGVASCVSILNYFPGILS